MEDYDKYMILQEQLSRNELILRRIAGGAGNLSRVCEVCLQPWPGQAVFRGEKRVSTGKPDGPLRSPQVILSVGRERSDSYQAQISENRIVVSCGLSYG